MHLHAQMCMCFVNNLFPFKGPHLKGKLCTCHRYSLEDLALIEGFAHILGVPILGKGPGSTFLLCI